MPETPDRTAAIRARHPAALDAVVHECLPALLRAARAAGLRLEAAEDAVQETFLVFVRRAPDFDGRARVLTWLYGILLNKIAESRRAHARESDHDDIEGVMEARFGEAGEWIRPPRGPAEELARGEVRRELMECLDDLPARQRHAFVLREVEALETIDICDALAVSANHLGVLLYRARNQLRECLEARGVKGSVDALV